ncbi:MAG TPA: hypothetical protein VGH00_06635 [Chthoniobacterales bacterium]
MEAADIIYFPDESLSLDSHLEAGWKLLDTMRHTAGSFALASDLPVTDEKHRGFFAEAGRAGAEIVSLRPPAQLTVGEPLPAFEPPDGDFEKFARRFSPREPNEAKLRRAYETALLADEFAAARISAHFREHRGEKILVFLHRDHIARDHGVPYFVAQKTKARQLILNPQTRGPGPGLLTLN